MPRSRDGTRSRQHNARPGTRSTLPVSRFASTRASSSRPWLSSCYPAEPAYRRERMHIGPETLIDALRQQGLRITQARRTVCSIIAERHGEHLTAASILEEVRIGRSASADQSTVYRTLDALEESGLVVHSHLGHGPAVYHLAAEAEHQHIVCRVCGMTASVPTPVICDRPDPFRRHRLVPDVCRRANRLILLSPTSVGDGKVT